MNFKKRVNGSWTDTPHYIHNTATDTLAILPAVLYPTGTTATVGLKGNTLQSSVPSPTSPVMPNGTGERTGNLLDYSTVESTTNATATQISGGISVSGRYYVRFRTVKFTVGSAYTMSWKANTTSGTSAPTWRFHYTDNTYSSMPSSGGALVVEKEVSELLLYVGTSASCVVEFTEIMLNTGSTPLPYENFGYKIPISSNSTTTPVYLGEVQTTRKIKKLVLTGTNADGEWKKSTTRIGSFYLNVETNAIVALGLCDRAINVGIIQQYDSIGKMFIESSGSSKLINLWLFDTNISLDDFKSYLAQQYANGTPVTVWYVLAKPKTAVVNEPLMKIGDYADEVSGVSIPVTAGANTLSIGTTVQPSEVTVNYKGWHPVQSVHECENGAWT